MEVDPHRIAVRTARGDITLSFGELVAASARIGDQLRAAGIEPGVPVGLAASNCIEFVLGLFGIASVGAVAAPLDPHLAAEEIETRLGDVDGRALIVPSGQLPIALSSTGSPLSAARAGMRLSVLELAVRAGVAGPDTSITSSQRVQETAPPAAKGKLPRDCVLIMFTAGTTGRSKAVPWTATAVSASVNGIIGSLELTAEDATVLVMPLFHGHGLMTGLLATLGTGGTVTLPDVGRFSASRFWPEMVGAGATWYTAVPTIHQILLARAPQEYPGPDQVRLRFIRSCSAPLAESVASSIEATFRAPIVCAYGMTETAHQAASMPVGEAQWRTGASVGAATSVEIRIRGSEGAEAATGDEGEILVRGDALTPGYLNDDEANRAAFVDGWFVDR